MPPLTWNVRESDARTVVVLQGELTLARTTELHTLLLKCLAEQPEALLIELSGLTVTDETALAVFTSVVRQAAIWPGIPVMLCATPDPIVALVAGGGYGRLSLYASVDAALPMVEAGPPTIVDRLLPETGAPREARELATEACLRWSIPKLIGPACLVVSELVTNAVEHAQSLMTVRLSRRDRYVHIAVRDSSPIEPALRRPRITETGGRGLMLVSSVAVHWGSMPCTDGKVVWATLAT